MIVLAIHLHTLLLAGADRLARLRDERGQATSEYALVLLGVGAVAMLFLAWAGSTGKIGELFDAALDRVRRNVR